MKVATNRDETRPKVRLYHGSNVEVKKPSLGMGRKKTDFGRGFYTTTQKEQAEHWTSIKMDRAKKGRKMKEKYSMDMLMNLIPEDFDGDAILNAANGEKMKLGFSVGG